MRSTHNPLEFCPMTRHDPESLCGICGMPHVAEATHGERVVYFVVTKRGGVAHFREPDPEAKVRRTDAAILAFQLGVDESSLPGRWFSCWVEPAEYGVFESDFRLEEPQHS
ncbi:hypothetical protein JIG36_24725 [Actinoplanes sp. LDG1-06]|uniref:Uncharacterized protein n=1 Tax=Paractinoplanes ovalisporus TaxID=2810368 RepID=A0ABS2AG12_9ACTN|nr:hypothetical protein [Actinoplanes ovalisporus]MBM2618767.1 hypothetical protein [Actinoplanes ovalisporus]